MSEEQEQERQRLVEAKIEELKRRLIDSETGNPDPVRRRDMMFSLMWYSAARALAWKQDRDDHEERVLVNRKGAIANYNHSYDELGEEFGSFSPDEVLQISSGLYLL
ncbi:MAG TPA: hypothetical protein VMW41_05430 [Candidatus Bathyarchaeia archaeon]|nr:hypothetical protein [Candidatus Bathyarchaeia archaeon]